MGEINLSLKPYNTFGIDVRCDEFVEVHDLKSLEHILLSHDYKPAGHYFILGGGSNILLRDRIKKIVLYNQIKGLNIVESKGNETIIAAGGGEIWNDLVMWALANGLGGIENLSLIPGSVGAAPIQNIGAYGVELKDVFYKLDAIHLETAKKRSFYAEECDFAYRNSVFKTALKGQYFITKVYLKLTNSNHILNTSYGAIQQELTDQGILEPGIKDVSNSIISIRRSKLPDPKELGNSGSFFKNPVVSEYQLNQLKSDFPDLRYFPFGERQFKLAAGWLIEQAGWKGKRIGETGCYKHQSLVIVNYGQATGKEVWNHAERVIKSVHEKFGVSLEPEVNILPE